MLKTVREVSKRLWNRPNHRETPVVAAHPIGMLPQFLLAEQLGGQLRAFINAKGLADWRIFTQQHPFLYRRFDEFLPDLNEADATWEPLSTLVPHGERFAALNSGDDDKPRWAPAGCMVLRRWNVAVARWSWFDPQENRFTGCYLFAAPTVAAFDALARRVAELAQRKHRPNWQILAGVMGRQILPRPEGLTCDRLVLAPAVRQRLDSDIAGFFTPAAAALYRELGLPYKRGVLLWGPPGNGKTSIIRAVASLRPDVAAFFLQPSPVFDDNDLREVMATWRAEAPAILVIEDLDWLLPRVSVSTFLNLLDGVDQRGSDGMMLLATTNHPEKLDPAINNRPGRFDVVIEIALPTKSVRLEYLRRHFPEIEPPAHERLAAQTDGLSFAHLQELRLRSGYLAQNQGRPRRTLQDVSEAVGCLMASHSNAESGFQGTTEKAFGFTLGDGG